jgi:5-oxoprolinase (ATP-hydrolysing) subunit A
MMSTLTKAARLDARVGAHPGFMDREHFGRRELDQAPDQIFQDCVYQVGALIALARVAGVTTTYIKAHGALYNMACRDDKLAQVVLRVADFFDLPIMGLPGSRLELLARERRRFVAEGFADRRYRSDGTLVPRDQADAFVNNPDEAAAQALRLVRERGVETICVHGDNPHAVQFVRALREALTEAGCEIRPFT